MMILETQRKERRRLDIACLRRELGDFVGV
jgi:hypothetical protein